MSVYGTFFDTQWAAHQATYDSYATNATDYYTLSYVLNGFISMWQGTRDLKYLNQVLTWCEAGVAAATITDNAGYKCWPPGTQGADGHIPPYATVPIAQQLDEMQGGVPFARLAYVILTDPALSAYYVRANAVLAFVRDHIFYKQNYTRAMKSWNLGYLNDLTPGGAGVNDKTVLDTTIGLWLAALYDKGLLGSANVNFKNDPETWMSKLITHLVPFGSSGAAISDYGRYDPATYHNVTLDCSHYNRWPACYVTALELGGKGGVNIATLRQIALDLTEVMWNGSTTNPRITNFNDGTDTMVSVAWDQPGEASAIYHGWCLLANVDARARACIKAVVDCGIANPNLNTTTNANLSLSNTWGPIGICGALERALTFDLVAPSMKRMRIGRRAGWRSQVLG